MGDGILLSTAAAEDESSENHAEGTLTQGVEAVLKEGHGVKFIHRFALNLLNTLLKNEKNFVVNSLISFCSVNAMTLAANGSTRDELSKALINIHFQNENEESEIMNKIKSCVEEASKLQYLKTPSYLYVSNEYKICDHFKEFSSYYFGVSARQSNFDEKGVIYMNEKIKYDTDSNIGSTIKELGQGIKMLLIDCSYFCGIWKQGFWQVKPSNFTNYNDTTSEVDFMHGFGMFKTGYNKKLRCHIIELPYQSETAKMVVLMPEKGVNFQNFIAITSSDIELMEIITNSRLKYEQSEVWLPKFRSEFIISMKAFYRQLGIHEIFDSSKADFSRLLDSKDGTSHYGLFLGDIIQKVVFEVKEDGERICKLGQMINATNIFKCNRPFLFFVLINYKQTQLMLFEGAVKLL